MTMTCSLGFPSLQVDYAMSSIKVPEPVMSVALTPKSTDQLANFNR